MSKKKATKRTTAKKVTKKTAKKAKSKREAAHADLFELLERAGSRVAAAKALGVSAQTTALRLPRRALSLFQRIVDPQPVPPAPPPAASPEPPEPAPAPKPPPVVNYPARLLPGTLRQWVDLFEAQESEEYRQSIALSVFDKLSLSPGYADILSTPYCEAEFSSHPLHFVARAADLSSSGRTDEALGLLRSLNERSPTAFHANLVSRLLMRPPGREDELIAHLKGALEEHPGDLHLALNLATTLHVVGRTAEANALLEKVQGPLEKALSGFDEELAELTTELALAVAEKRVHRVTKYDSEMYLEENIKVGHWEPYFSDMVGHPPHLMFGWLKNYYRDQVCAALEASQGRARKIVNFGVMCAQADYEVAQRYPGVEIYGVDRQRVTATQNEQAYPLENLHFLTGEIEDLLGSITEPGDEAIFFHGRVATLCYPEKVRQLYELCARCGVTQIILFENAALTHETYRFVDLAAVPGDSMIYKNFQFIHNYPKLLSETGFTEQDQHLMASPLLTVPGDPLDLGSVHVLLHARRPQ